MSWQNPFWLLTVFVVGLLGVQQKHGKDAAVSAMHAESARLAEANETIDRYRTMSKFWQDKAYELGYKPIGSP